jgi:hypothetical protein
MRAPTAMERFTGALNSKSVPPVKSTSMRAATVSERISNALRSLYEGVAEQPLARITDLAGMTGFGDIAKNWSNPEPQMGMGIMPGGPGKGLGKALINPSDRIAATPNSNLSNVYKNASGYLNQPSSGVLESRARANASLTKDASMLSDRIAAPPELTFEEQLANLERGLGGKSISLAPETGPLANASGESMASVEAINRIKEMASKGQKFVVRKKGTARDLPGVEGVDYKPRPGEEYGIMDNGVFRLLQRGE